MLQWRPVNARREVREVGSAFVPYDASMRPIPTTALAAHAASVLGIGCSSAPAMTPDPSVQQKERMDELVRDRGGTAEVYREILSEASCARLFTMSENYASLRDDPATSRKKVDVFACFWLLAGNAGSSWAVEIDRAVRMRARGPRPVDLKDVPRCR
jgi:hypothetical protein